MTTEPIIRINDVRRARMCTKGLRQWFYAKDLDYRDFLSNGMRVADVRALRDGLADELLERLGHGK